MPTLSESVSKVTLSPEILNSPLMTKKRKEELRVNAIKDYIQSKPYGTRIALIEFANVARFRDESAAFFFIKRLIRDGVIVKHDISPRRFFYTVPAPVVVTKVADRVPAPPSADKTPAQPVAATPSVVPARSLTIDQFEQRAMRFALYNPYAPIGEFIRQLREENHV